MFASEQGVFGDGTSFSIFTFTQGIYEGKRGVRIGETPNAKTFVVSPEYISSIFDVLARGSNKNVDSQALWRSITIAILNAGD